MQVLADDHVQRRGLTCFPPLSETGSNGLGDSGERPCTDGGRHQARLRHFSGNLLGMQTVDGTHRADGQILHLLDTSQTECVTPPAGQDLNERFVNVYKNDLVPRFTEELA